MQMKDSSAKDVHEVGRIVKAEISQVKFSNHVN